MVRVVKVPSYAGARDTRAGGLDVFPLKVREESAGCEVKRISRGELLVVVVTSKNPPLPSYTLMSMRYYNHPV